MATEGMEPWEIVNLVYGFPSYQTTIVIYSLGFAFVFIPWVISWSAGRLAKAIQLI